MLLSILLERMNALPDGGIVSNESRFKLPMLESMAVSFLGQMLQLQYVGSKDRGRNTRINPLYYRKHWPKFRTELQDTDECFVVFDCPSMLTLNDNSDGIRYCGTISGTTGFNRIQSRPALATINKHQVMKTIANDSEYPSFLYDGNRNLIEVYGDRNITEILLELLPANPMDIPTFNKDTDDFILDSDVPNFLAMNFAQETALEKRQPVDLVSGDKPQPTTH